MRPSLLFFLLTVSLVATGGDTWGQNAAEGPGVRDILSTKDLSVPAQRRAAAREVERWQRGRKAEAAKKARRLGVPERRVLGDGTTIEVSHLDENSGGLVYLTTHNANAAISTGAMRLRTIQGLTGAGVVVGVWDGGTARAAHQEYGGGRVVVRDNGALGDHATHVTGTIAASGIDLMARGMATGVSVDSYDWINDSSEMISRGRAEAGQTDKILLSNHSYGYIRGWYWDGFRYSWGGLSGNTASSVETNFGRYGNTTQSVDSIAHDAPYYLMFWSAGNDRNNNPSAGSTVNIGGNLVSYNPTFHPPGDGVYRSGYDTLADTAVGKNVLTIGAVNDAVSGGERDLVRATWTGFTSWGPTDDGRIKPDLMANGASLYSTTSGSNTSYGFSSGTSMAAPNAAGTAALLIQHYSNLFPGQAMRASTLKGLLIHTADDLGRPGPDYQYGWGLINGERGYAQISARAEDPNRLAMVEEAVSSGVPVRTHLLRWDGESPIKVTICWTDRPGNIISGSDSRVRHLVNDLNVKVVAPSGAEFYPFVMPFVGTWTTASMGLDATTGINTTDNVEQVIISSPQESGVYQVIVSHAGSLTGSEQQYSLLVSGSGALQTAPAISAIQDVVGEEDRVAGPISFSVDSPIVPASQLLVWAEHDNSDLIEEITLGGSGSDRTIALRPKRDAYGEAVVTVFASDGTDISQASFAVSFTPVNDPPVVTPGFNLVFAEAGETVDFGFLVEDVDTPISDITVEISSAGDPVFSEDGVTFQHEGGGSFVATVRCRQGAEGNGSVIIKASDGVDEDFASVTFFVSNPNPTFSQWTMRYLTGTGADDRPTGDPDGDGIANAVEYFLGLNPLEADSSGVMSYDFSGGGAALEYRRRVNLDGAWGEVRWTTDLTQSGGWTSQGVEDTVLWTDGDFEWRRAEVAWPVNTSQIFMRLEVGLE